MGFFSKSRINTGFCLVTQTLLEDYKDQEVLHNSQNYLYLKQRKDLASVIIKSHITRSLFLLLYLFSKIVLVPRKRVRGSAGGHFLWRGNPDYPFSGQNFYPLLSSNVFFLLLSLCPFFSRYLFSNPLF